MFSGQPTSTSPLCAALSSNDTLWYSVPCTTPLPVLCQQTLSAFALGTAQPFANAAIGCSSGVFGVPSSALDNRHVAAMMQQQGVAKAWINAPAL